MPTLQRACLVLGAVVALTSVVAATPARRTQWNSSGQKVSASVRGELVRVDSDARVLVVKPAEGLEVPFAYNDETKVIGTGAGVAGLATMVGTRVTVRYTTEGRDRLATEVDVHASR